MASDPLAARSASSLWVRSGRRGAGAGVVFKGDGVVLREVGTWGPALCLWGAARLLFPARSHLGMLRHDWEGAPANGAQPSGRCNTSRSQSLQFWVFSPLALRSGPAPRHFVGGRGGLHFADRTRS
jgi:hypothetical protein